MTREEFNVNLELAHHGIKGQKWGIRRFQNDDGSLTSAGKQHYGTGTNGAGESKSQRSKIAKNANRLSDKELNARNDRLEREAKLKRNTKATNDHVLSKSDVKKVLADAGKEVLKNTATTAGIIGLSMLLQGERSRRSVSSAIGKSMAKKYNK